MVAWARPPVCVAGVVPGISLHPQLPVGAACCCIGIGQGGAQAILAGPVEFATHAGFRVERLDLASRSVLALEPARSSRRFCATASAPSPARCTV